MGQVMTARIGFFLLVFLFSPAGRVAAQDFWQPTTGPGGGAVHDLAAGEGGVLYAIVGQDTRVENELYRSLDGGETWGRRTLPDKALVHLGAAPDGPLYAAAAGSWTYRSDDGGLSWSSLSPPGGSALDFAFDDQGRVFIGTTTGVFVSGDDGETWQAAGLDGRTVSRLACKATDHLFALLDDGAYETNDSGTTWQRVAALQAGLALLPHPDGGLYVSAGRIFGPAIENTGVYRLDPEGNLAFSGVKGLFVTSMAVNADGHVFAATLGSCSSFGCTPPAGIYRSVDDGATWEAVGPASTGVGVLVALPNGDLLAGTRGLSSDSGFGSSRGILRSSDDGASWLPSDTGIPRAWAYALAAGPGGIVYAAADQHVSRTLDGGEHWTPVYAADPAGEQADTPYYFLAVHPGGDLFVLVSRDRLVRSSDQGETWTTLPLDVVSTDIRLLGVAPSGTVFLRFGSRGVLRSEDRGETWAYVDVGFGPVVTLGSDPDGRLFAAAWDAAITTVFLFVSTDDGRTWTEVGTVPRHVHTFQFPVAGNGYVLTSRTLYHLQEAGGFWTITEEALPADVMDDLIVTPDGTMFAASQTDGVFASTDGGRTWTSLNEGLPFEEAPFPVNDLLLDSEEVYLYAATSGRSVVRSIEPVVTDLARESLLPPDAVPPETYPNPFQKQVTVAFTLEAPAPVTLQVYDLLGRRVAGLRDGEWMSAGPHEVAWQPDGLPAGVYLYRLTVGRRMTGGTLVRQ